VATKHVGVTGQRVSSDKFIIADVTALFELIAKSVYSSFALLCLGMSCCPGLHLPDAQTKGEKQLAPQTDD
jgi:hypothetical protein